MSLPSLSFVNIVELRKSLTYLIMKCLKHPRNRAMCDDQEQTNSHRTKKN